MTDRFVTVPDSLELPAAVKVPSARLSDSTAAGRALLAGADAAAQRASLELGSAATTPAADRPPSIRGKLAGLKYDGTDETATLQGIIDALSAAGGGVVELEGLVRCDGQITFPTTVRDTRLHMAPIRITGVGTPPASGAWPPYSGGSPYTTAGLDLRYAGRTDAGCATVKGSAWVANTSAIEADRGLIVSGVGIPGRAWVLHSKPGEGWALTKAARATGTAALNVTGGRLQATGYGKLEIDRLQLISGAPTSAPFGITTGTTAYIHDNAIFGHVDKTGAQCDEDAWVFGGPGQGTVTTAELAAGVAVTSIPVAAIPVNVKTGAPVTVAVGTSAAVTLNLTADASRGATSLAVSFTPAATLPTNTGVYIGVAASESTPYSYDVPSSQFNGFISRFDSNHMVRVRSVVAGGYATDLHISHNAWMHNTGSNLAGIPSTLATPLVKGTSYTTLAVTALDRAILAGDVVQVGAGDVHQETVAAADAAAGSLSVTVVPFTANAAYAAGTLVFNTQHIGAQIESWAVSGAANTITAIGNRCGFSGGYNFMTRFAGVTTKSVLVANNVQDLVGYPHSIGVHRFERGAVSNTIVAALDSGSVKVDDFSTAGGGMQQVYIGNGEVRGAGRGAQRLKSYPGATEELCFFADETERYRMYALAGDARLYVRDIANNRTHAQWVPGATADLANFNLLSTLTVTGHIKHTGTGLGLFGATSTTKKEVTGSRGGNAALASLLTALAAYGLITDSTTA